MKGCRMSRGLPDFASGVFGLWGPVPTAFALLARRASSRSVDRLSPSRPLHSKVPLWSFLLLLLSLVRAPAEGSRRPTYSFVLLHVCRRGLAARGGHTISSGAGGPYKRRSQRLAAWTIAGQGWPVPGRESFRVRRLGRLPGRAGGVSVYLTPRLQTTNTTVTSSRATLT